jgi:hypothetical protein
MQRRSKVDFQFIPWLLWNCSFSCKLSEQTKEVALKHIELNTQLAPPRPTSSHALGLTASG